MKNFLLLFLIFSLNLYASGIQQQDIKTEAQCISAGATAANCLPLSSQIYDAVLGKKLSTILDSGSLGSATAAVGQVLTANGSGGSYWGSGIAVFPPVITTYTSGTGTFVTPTSPTPLYLKIKLVGGGGGGAGSSQNANNGGSGSSGGDTIFGSTSIGGGNGSSGGIGGFGSGCTSFSGVSSGFGINGQDGGQATVIAATTNAWTPPVFGGSSPFGLYGSGGSGAPGANESGVTQSINGGGGGASCYGEIIITSPTSTYSYSVGVAGIGGTAGTAGSPGRDGGQGFIFIEAHFQ